LVQLGVFCENIHANLHMPTKVNLKTMTLFPDVFVGFHLNSSLFPTSSLFRRSLAKIFTLNSAHWDKVENVGRHFTKCLLNTNHSAEEYRNYIVMAARRKCEKPKKVLVSHKSLSL